MTKTKKKSPSKTSASKSPLSVIEALRLTASYLRGLQQSVYEDTVKLMLAKKDQRINLSDVIDTLADVEEESRC